MASNENHFEFAASQDNESRGGHYGLHPLHEAAFRLADLGLSRKRSRTKDLIGLLLCHGARAWRYSQPEANIHLHVSSQAGRFPVLLRLR
ncbi:hypothetical protein G6N76_10610 [Rhizobium daejeonense]|uniref:Uncharacterized protein n=2 Tax=Rhizobiaceae TaxID=82115 RepID=A0A6M1S493_9HYPH|nr:MULTISPECIES: hypothetical protein [Rhizobiaceae]ATN34250.1 hypothetical protein ACO34A_10600 [Rhizobium sp. ACO-34A]MCM2399675.1 hypothetical protein [Ciceribacter sp. S153]NGO64127.1 hypothetical protein [Rhizobium daejeonense]PZU85168.1 MAG: hypothetical protein DI528_12565 [Shinella sp.]